MTRWATFVTDDGKVEDQLFLEHQLLAAISLLQEHGELDNSTSMEEATVKLKLQTMQSL